ncbi:unnamed protein product [Caenorhabditis brenneri]
MFLLDGAEAHLLGIYDAQAHQFSGPKHTSQHDPERLGPKRNIRTAARLLRKEGYDGKDILRRWQMVVQGGRTGQGRGLVATCRLMRRQEKIDVLVLSLFLRRTE